MSKPYYVKFEIPADLVDAVYEAVRVAKDSGKIRKGTNESTKAIERGISKLTVISSDVEPPEVVAHLPILCEERNTPYVFVPSKQRLGESLGLSVGSAAATIVEAGEGQHIVDEIVNTIKNITTKKE
ncbi:MAG: 50S ribosomal protein L7ae [Nitrososphaeraceae archaeon]|nr:50S ribosomal protein L7ae [Nitrososphaeraceae archaeon]